MAPGWSDIGLTGCYRSWAGLPVVFGRVGSGFCRDNWRRKNMPTIIKSKMPGPNLFHIPYLEMPMRLLL